MDPGSIEALAEDPSEYKSATKALVQQGRALSADPLLIDRAGRRALMLECKDSNDVTYVGRDGYHQATTYLIEAHGRLSDETVSLTVGHAAAVRGLSVLPLAGGLIGLTQADLVAEIVERFIVGEPIDSRVGRCRQSAPLTP